jgi:hypothetical protein
LPADREDGQSHRRQSQTEVHGGWPRCWTMPPGQPYPGASRRRVHPSLEVRGHAKPHFPGGLFVDKGVDPDARDVGKRNLTSFLTFGAENRRISGMREGLSALEGMMGPAKVAHGVHQCAGGSFFCPERERQEERRGPSSTFWGCPL